MTNISNQKNNNANVITGRDYLNQSTTNLIFNKSQELSAVADIYLRIVQNSDQYLDDDTYEEVKESLLRYKTPKSEMKNIQIKLKESNREELIDEALELKESTIKFMTRYEASNSGEFILVHILSTIASKHKAYVVPAIKENLPRTTIDAIIDERVIGSALEIMNGTNRTITSERMYGLMYYLAGNCHIKWTI